MFNDVGEFILSIFPNASINGNYDKPGMLGEFEIYLRSLGFKRNRDHFDRFFIFKKSIKARFPEKDELID
jgi:hypothetical protein